MKLSRRYRRLTRKYAKYRIKKEKPRLVWDSIQTKKTINRIYFHAQRDFLMHPQTFIDITFNYVQ